mmetsp:Transcript_11111/g.22129  ORF Transcript_11111/g.22129 Transcript_11111/m.22129 type:complete len:204 (+) Transcript_11111:67-678(+)
MLTNKCRTSRVPKIMHTICISSPDFLNQSFHHSRKLALARNPVGNVRSPKRSLHGDHSSDMGCHVGVMQGQSRCDIDSTFAVSNQYLPFSGDAQCSIQDGVANDFRIVHNSEFGVDVNDLSFKTQLGPDMLQVFSVVARVVVGEQSAHKHINIVFQLRVRSLIPAAPVLGFSLTFGFCKQSLESRRNIGKSKRRIMWSRGRAV